MKKVNCPTGHRKGLLTLAIVLTLLVVLALGTPVRAAPAITLYPTSGAVGTKVTVNGTVFDSYKGDNIYIFFDDTEIPGSPLTVDDTGTFTITLSIPGDATPGRHWVEARTETTPSSMLARSFFIVEEAEIWLDMADGPVGTEVTINGIGFYANRTVTLYYYNVIGEKIGTATASPIGEFTHQFTIPNSTAGEHRITAANNEGNSAETEFGVIPSVNLNLTSAGPGELLTVMGTGFGPKTEVDINFGVRPVARVRTDEHGNFDIIFNIPEVKPDTYIVKALDDYGNTANARFITTAGAKLDQTAGSVGSKLTVSGSGFKPRETVSIDYDNLRVAAVTTDNNGAFTANFNVPASASGAHVITVSDGETTKQFAFTMESEAPPVPNLLLPADSSESRAEAYLDWQDARDPSQPVAYSLQVAADQNFSSLVLAKDGLLGSEYTLTAEERLAAVKKHTPYYWRVKARDSAGNESEWSALRSFYISAPPVPALTMPASGSRAGMPAFFNWQSVTSLSPPVTYTLQVSTDLNFTSTMLEKKGLADSEYTMTEDEELLDVRPEAPYYWRVKAIDSAGNESEWSAPWSFYTGSSFTFPGWAIYTLIGIGVIIVGFLAFRVGRRTAFSPPG